MKHERPPGFDYPNLSERTDKANEHSISYRISIGMKDLAPKRKRVRQRRKRKIKKKAAAGKPRVRKRRVRKQVSYNPLIAILVFLYMLKLIDEKTLTRITQGLYPEEKKKRAKGTPRRRRKSR